jgi:hypothetical protein
MATVLAYSGSVCAQAACQGNFVLPFDVQWNGRTLPAGQYHFTLSSATLGGILFIRDAQENGKMMAMTKGIGKISRQSALTVVKRNGQRHVSSLALEPIGATLVYSVPAQSKAAAEREIEASVQVIPVQILRS